MYKQLVAPNLPNKGTVGLCQAYARSVFGVPAVYANAWEDWVNAQYKHTDALPDAIVPVSFSYVKNGVNLGHKAVWVPGRGFYSSPYKQGTSYALLPSIKDIERIYGVKYVGWSEDINKVRVVESYTPPPPQEDPVRIIELEQQNRDLQAQINILRPDLVAAVNRIDKLIETQQLNEAELLRLNNELKALGATKQDTISQVITPAVEPAKKSFWSRFFGV